jgi:hypothetical protein
MHIAQLLFMAVTLVVPLGLIEQGFAVHDGFGLQLMQSCPGESSDSSDTGESEIAESDFYLHETRSFEPGNLHGCSLAAFRSDPVAAIDVDPTGLRPPPLA